MIATLVAAFESGSAVLVIFLIIFQTLALAWYRSVPSPVLLFSPLTDHVSSSSLSFIPYARKAVINMCFPCLRGVVSV